jgi:hypothetical protein
VPDNLSVGCTRAAAFSDWQVTCNNQNFCVARNTGEHHGLVMTLSRSAGAQTSAALRIDLGGKDSLKRGAHCAAPALDGKPLGLTPNAGKSPGI